MAIHFLFPRDSAVPANPEEMFADQWNSLIQAGYSTSLCADAVVSGTQSLCNVPPRSNVVYRGWMVKGDQYATLVRAIDECGAKAFTSPREYLAAHHLPNWYPLLRGLTPETRVYPKDVDLVAELRALDWNAYFLKDPEQILLG